MLKDFAAEDLTTDGFSTGRQLWTAATASRAGTMRRAVDVCHSVAIQATASE